MIINKLNLPELCIFLYSLHKPNQCPTVINEFIEKSIKICLRYDSRNSNSLAMNSKTEAAP